MIQEDPSAGGPADSPWCCELGTGGAGGGDGSRARNGAEGDAGAAGANSLDTHHANAGELLRP